MLFIVVKQGDKIYASIRRTLVYKFKSLLRENETYHCSYIRVGDFITTSHEVHLNFQYVASIKSIKNNNMDMVVGTKRRLNHIFKNFANLKSLNKYLKCLSTWIAKVKKLDKFIFSLELLLGNSLLFIL